jgi:hypothetical protein
MNSVKENIPRKDNININVILSYGIEAATIIMEAYNSNSVQSKLINIEKIAKLDNIKDEAKVKFIGDVLIRPKFKRLFIANKLRKKLEEKNE